MILSETRIGNREYTGKGVFKGYKLVQHSSSGERNKGVCVFARIEAQLIEGTERNARDGHSTVAAYTVQGAKVVVGGVYGPSVAGDREAEVVMRRVVEEVRELKQLVGTEHVIVAGDLNLKLDVRGRNSKPRAVRVIREAAEQLRLRDMGEGNGKEATWRRPNLPNSKSRLDYILSSESLQGERFQVRWSRYDHAELTCGFTVGTRQEKRSILKDWALTTPEFLEGAPRIVAETLMDHDRVLRGVGVQEREAFTQGRLPRAYEGELRVEEVEEGVRSSHVMAVLVQRVTQLQSRVQKDYVSRRRKRLEEMQKDIGRTYKSLDRVQVGSPAEVELRERLDSLKTQLRDDAENVEEAGRRRVEHFYMDNNGKNRAASFSVAKEPKHRQGISKLVEGEEEVTDRDEIVLRLEEKFRANTGQRFEATMTLRDFMARYEVEVTRLSEEERTQLEEEIGEHEVKEALATAKKNAAPGPTGQTSAIFKYLLAEVPKLLVKTLNELTFVEGLAASPPFAWLFKRTVRYIPKPGKQADRAGNLRPLSLLETMYKIKTRILSQRLMRVLDTVLYADQHGFRQNRSIQTAVLPVLEALKEAEMEGRPMQLLAVDLKSAYDCISPQVIKEVMDEQEFPGIFTEAMHRLTKEGTARVLVNQVQGREFRILCGAGQGDPPSAGRFNIGSDPSLRALNKVTEEYRYRFSMGRRMPVNGFADDHLFLLELNSPEQVKNILKVYEDFQKVSGLQVSREKTVILGVNTDPRLLEEISRETGIEVVTQFRYLGVQITGTYEGTREESYRHVQAKVVGRGQRINSAHLDLFHKRQLIKQALMPSFNHLFMIFGHMERVERELDELVIRLLWTKSKEGEVKQKRRLVAKKRVSLSYNMGG